MPELEQRLIDLEIKASFTEDLVDKLDQIIIRQQRQLDALTREVLALRDLANQPEQQGPRQARDELPPHY